MLRRPGTVLVILFVLAGAACGSSPAESADGIATANGASTRSAGEEGSTDPQQAALDFAECMREHGIDVPDPQGDRGGLVVVGPAAGAAAGGSVSGASGPPEEFVAAHEACKHFLDDLVQEGHGRMDPEAQDRALKFAQCMREHGVDMPDPNFSGGGVTIQLGGSGLDPMSDTFKKAQEACGPALGAGVHGTSAGVRLGAGRA